MTALAVLRGRPGVSYPGGRMPVWKSQDKIRKHWLYSLSAFDILAGVFTMFGRSDGSAQRLIEEMGMPMTLWAFLLLVGSSGILLGFNKSGSACCAAVWTGLTAASLLTVAAHTALWSAGWVLPASMLWWHVLVILEVGSGLDADREHRQRGQ